MKKHILTVTLNPAIDKTVKVSDFRIGKDFREEALFLSAGGKGINVSRVLKYLGVPSLATGFIGGGPGSYIKQRLDQEKIKKDFSPISGNTRTSLTVIDPLKGSITRVLERGPSISASELKLFKKKYTSLLRNCCWVILSGRNIPGAPDSFYGQLIQIAKDKNVPSLLDTSGKAYELGVKKKPFMIKPNLKEAEQLLGEEIDSFSKCREALLKLSAKGIKITALTLGSQGAIAYDQKEILFAKPPRIKRKNPVGCGDAFIAGFIASLYRKKDFELSLRLAVACGAANALSINPGFIKPGTIKEIIKKISIKKIKI